MKNTNEVLREQARSEFFSTNAPLSDIADKVGVTRQTLSLWAANGNWHTLKINSMRSPAVLVDSMYAELQDLADAIAARPEGQRHPTIKEADVRRKTILSIRDLKKGPSASEAQQLLKAFSVFMYEKDEKAAKMMNQYLSQFLNSTDNLGYKPYEVEYRAAQHYKQPVREPELEEEPLEKPEPVLLSDDMYTSSDNVIDDVLIPQPLITEDYKMAYLIRRMDCPLEPEQIRLLQEVDHKLDCCRRQAKRMGAAHRPAYIAYENAVRAYALEAQAKGDAMIDAKIKAATQKAPSVQSDIAA